MRDKEFLKWIYGRLVRVHGENPLYDYMHKLRAVVEGTPEEQDTNWMKNDESEPVDKWLDKEKYEE